MTKMTGFAAAAAALIAAAAAPALAQSPSADADTASGTPQAKIEVGVLTCDMTAKSNYVVLSKSEYLCTLDSADDAEDATYVAKIDKVGIDLNLTEKEKLYWAVLASTEKFTTDMMDGQYVGASADAALGLGAGVKVLVGGEADQVSLQPVSASAQAGIGIAAGLEKMELRRVTQ